jgi:hypothetical protein
MDSFTQCKAAEFHRENDPAKVCTSGYGRGAGHNKLNSLQTWLFSRLVARSALNRRPFFPNERSASDIYFVRDAKEK